MQNYYSKVDNNWKIMKEIQFKNFIIRKVRFEIRKPFLWKWNEERIKEIEVIIIINSFNSFKIFNKKT